MATDSGNGNTSAGTGGPEPATKMVELAEHYAVDLGWAVFPLAPNAKTPATANGFKAATTDVDRIRAWWRANPSHGVGLANVRHVVLDVDTKAGKRGAASLEAMQAQFGALPDTWTARTPSGGLHFYFAAASSPVRRRCPISADYPDVDLCGFGGYVCAPPTVVDGRRYEWTSTDKLAPLPPWVAELLGSSSTQPEPSSRRRPGRWSSDVEHRARRALAYVEHIDGAVAGSGGHHRTFEVAIHLVRGFDLPRSVASEIFTYWNQRCDPPWSSAELEHKLDDAERSKADRGYLLERGAA